MKLRTENRGSKKAEIGAKNRERVVSYFKENPSATLRDASEALGLSTKTVHTHIKAYEAGK